jgi:hypothetical protein
VSGPVEPLRNAARAATSPMRNYINQHFEMVKDEIRHHQPVVNETAAWERVAELENTVSEMSLHQAQLLARLRDQMGDLDARLARLETLVERLADVVGAMTVE